MTLRDGVDLSNTRRRLRHLYGEEHRFDLDAPDDHGLKVNIEIPYKEADKTL